MIKFIHMLKIHVKKKYLFLINKRTSALLSGKTDKYEYFTGEEILPPDQRRVIEQGNFTFSQLWKALERQIRTIEDRGRKKIKAVEDHWKQFVESNEIAKKEVNIDRDSVPLEEQKKIL